MSYCSNTVFTFSSLSHSNNMHIGYNALNDFIYISAASPPSDVTAVQTGPTSIRVTWTPPIPLDGITGYIIYYTNEDDSDSDSVTVSGGSTALETLTGLQNGDTYTISIVATSDTGLPSESVPADMSVGLRELYICTYFLHNIT